MKPSGTASILHFGKRGYFEPYGPNRGDRLRVYSNVANFRLRRRQRSIALLEGVRCKCCIVGFNR